MKKPSLLPAGSDVFGKMLFLAFAAVVGSFLVTNLIVQRSSAAVSVTSALLDFARSGARPDPGARTEPRTCEPVPPVLVACSTGVYLSGVTSERGSGSTFWFELQRAGSAWELSHMGEDESLLRRLEVEH